MIGCTIVVVVASRGVAGAFPAPYPPGVVQKSHEYQRRRISNNSFSINRSRSSVWYFLAGTSRLDSSLHRFVAGWSPSGLPRLHSLVKASLCCKSLRYYTLQYRCTLVVPVAGLDPDRSRSFASESMRSNSIHCVRIASSGHLMRNAGHSTTDNKDLICLSDRQVNGVNHFGFLTFLSRQKESDRFKIEMTLRRVQPFIMRTLPFLAPFPIRSPISPGNAKPADDFGDRIFEYH